MPLMFIKNLFRRKYICPYCFKRPYLYEVKFRCNNHNCVHEEDKVYSDFNELPRPRKMNRVLNYEENNSFAKLLARMPEEVICDACEQPTPVKICPNCHSDLPATTGDFSDLIFAVVGAKETGKSHYISVLIDTLKNEIGDAYDCTLEPLNDETIRRYNENFYKPVFEDKVTIDATRSGRTDIEVRHPLLYALKFYKKGPSNRIRIHKVVTLAFFDAAGEDLDEEDTMNIVNRYIYNSSGIILLLDPLQLNHIREKLTNDIHLPSKNTEGRELLHRMANLIRRAEKIKQNKKIHIPLAVVFSKIDAVRSLLDPTSSLHYASQHIESKGFNLTDFASVQSEIEGLINEWDSTEISRIIQGNYKTYGYFGVSALGDNPDEDRKIKTFEPYRVADPLLWLLAEYNVINTVKRG